MRLFLVTEIALVIMFAGFAARSQESVSDQARSLLEQAHAEQAAAMDAARQGDQAAYQRHSNQADDFMAQVRSLFEKAHIDDSSNPDDLAVYAGYRKELGDYDLAERALIRALSLSPDRADLWFALGELQALLGTDGEARAIKSLRKTTALDQNPELTAKAHAALGAVFLQQGLFDFARTELEAAVDADSGHVGARIALASLDVRDGAIGKASESLDALGEIGPEYMALMQRTIEKALFDFGESRRWMEDTADNHLAYAKLLVRAGRPGDSLLPLERAAELDPDNYVTWNLLGSMYRGFDRIEDARKAFARSLELNPDQPRTRSAMEELDAAAAPKVPLAPLAPQ
ncbi:MAG: hypothetical protein AMXMBFR82_38000 [Candidatus Hydrogenedentota bacterium]